MTLARSMYRIALALTALSLASACGGGGDGKASNANQSIAKALAGPPPPPTQPITKPDEAAGPRKKEIKPGEVPWSFAEVKTAVGPGTTVLYARSGTDAKGKKVSGQFKWQAKKTDDAGAGVIGVPTEGPVPPGSDQLATILWANLSPFFAIERAEVTVGGRESVTVPAGTFDCVVADVKGFFGAEQKVWMIIERPGIYAKVIDMGNAQEPKDKTEITYELAELPAVQAPAGPPP